jgi:hypothetical protein
LRPHVLAAVGGTVLASAQGIVTPDVLSETSEITLLLMVFVAGLLGSGARSLKPPTTQPWGRRSLWLRDPDGNIVNLYQQARSLGSRPEVRPDLSIPGACGRTQTGGLAWALGCRW